MLAEEVLQGVKRRKSTISDLKLHAFFGNHGEDDNSWLKYFIKYLKAIPDFEENHKADYFPFFLTSHARVWYDLLPEATQNNWDQLVNLKT